jgi:hypothetical protein
VSLAVHLLLADRAVGGGSGIPNRGNSNSMVNFDSDSIL